MDEFSKDCVRFGTYGVTYPSFLRTHTYPIRCVQCFRYFSVYLRGKEELLITVKRSMHTPSTSPQPLGSMTSTPLSLA